MLKQALTCCLHLLTEEAECVRAQSALQFHLCCVAKICFVLLGLGRTTSCMQTHNK